MPLAVVSISSQAGGAEAMNKFRLIARGAGIVALALAGTGCGTLKHDRGWGQDAIYPIQWERIPQAAKRAALDPVTWVPAVGALVFTIDDFDHKVSDWAVERTPVFGSTDTAEDVSDYLRDVLQVETIATVVLTPSGEPGLTWGAAKLRGSLVEAAAIGATSAATDLLKDQTGRTRPGNGNDRSFPSAHASHSFAGARLCNRNLDSISMNDTLRRSFQAGNLALAATVAWARVEGEKHYPTDVLVGAALGNFITTFIHDAFMNLPEDEEVPVSFYVEPSLTGVWGAVSWKF